MEKVLDELEEDFKHLVSKIPFSEGYDPFCAPFMKAALIGTMWVAMKNIEGDVEDELSGARKYFDTYMETGDNAYKEMASDELRHAGILIKKHLAESPDHKDGERLRNLEKERAEMQKEVSTATVPVLK